MRLLRSAPIFLLSGIVAGCGASATRPTSIIERGTPTYSAVSSTVDEASEEVLGTPLSFLIPFNSVQLAEQRADLFFSYYLKDTTASLKATGAAVVTRSATTPNFAFQISRAPSKKGYFYTVLVEPLGGSASERQDAVMNAHNLARFIRDGKLEVELLKR